MKKTQMKHLILAASLFAIPFIAHASDCGALAEADAQYELKNAINFANTSWADPDDKAYAACAGKPLQLGSYDDVPPPKSDSGVEYLTYRFYVECGNGVVWKWSEQFYPNQNCGLRGE